MKTIAVLALQGAFVEHERRLRDLGCQTLELRSTEDLRHGFDGLVLPGGESTTQSKLLHALGMFEPLRLAIAGGLPVLGTCAGMILLAEHVEGAGDLANRDSKIAGLRERVSGFRTLPITVERNSYGRQLGSRKARGRTCDGARIPLTFIRAPRIVAAGDGVDVLVQADDGPAAVRFENQVACAFHPELDPDTWLHRYWLDLC